MPHNSDTRPESSDDQHARKHQVLSHGSASAGHGIADALVIKDRDLYFLCKPDGDVPVGGDHGYGLYYNDCRFLRGYEMRLAGDLADRLASSAGAGNAIAIELTNPELQTSAKERVPKERVGLSWHRELDAAKLALHDTFLLENFGVEAAEFPIHLSFDACFEDIFDVRGLMKEQPGQLHEPAWRGGDLYFEYDGADGRRRSLTVEFDPKPSQKNGTQVGWDIKLERQQRKKIRVDVVAAVEAEDGKADAEPQRRGTKAGDKRRRQTKPADTEGFAKFSSNSRLLDGIVDRSFRDLQMLRSDNAGAEYFAAGVPWYVALFGRDSVITSIESLAYDPSVAEQTLRVLAAWQGTDVDDYRDEQPGKILHELRVGELARIGAVPHHPFYGSVDSTPLFCLLVARHAQWTGRLDLFEELREHVDAALEWIDRYGDSDGDGFIDYRSPDGSGTGKGLVNQGWKDSGNGIVNADGSIVTPPVALVEVQGYVFAAKRELADLFERAGDRDRADSLRTEADELRKRFEDRFWMEAKGTYALCLQKGGRQAAVVSSNPGQALWTGIVAPDRAARVCNSLMAEEMFSGWGVRTLSSKEARYNPVGYHLGTVWPHDNAIIAAGLRRYGFDDEAERIVGGITNAAAAFAEYRLPEVFAGYERSRFSQPVHYPVACHPQAWAAGSVPYLFGSMLGLEPDAFGHTLRVIRPALLPMVAWLELKGIRVGDARCDLRFERNQSGVAVEVTRVDGELEVLVEPAPLSHGSAGRRTGAVEPEHAEHRSAGRDGHDGHRARDGRHERGERAGKRGDARKTPAHGRR